ncbi:hypothetical protein [Streptococcus merionis]|uniref:hypothetical protein n=1 Tax=Streptococcus merionis TaxID=400065 RepID=UPI0035124723
MDSELAKDNAMHKLKEFPTWQQIGNVLEVSYSNDYILETTEPIDRSEWEHLLKWWQRLAPEEVNEIKRAVNQIEDKALRGYIIIYYLKPPDYPTSSKPKWFRLRPNWPEVRSLLGLKSNVTRSEIEDKALMAFARTYRHGLLESYTDTKKRS